MCSAQDSPWGTLTPRWTAGTQRRPTHLTTEARCSDVAARAEQQFRNRRTHGHLYMAAAHHPDDQIARTQVMVLGAQRWSVTFGAGVQPLGALRGSDAVRPAGRHDVAPAGRAGRRGPSDSWDVGRLFLAQSRKPRRRPPRRACAALHGGHSHRREAAGRSPTPRAGRRPTAGWRRSRAWRYGVPGR